MDWHGCVIRRGVGDGGRLVGGMQLEFDIRKEPRRAD